MKALRNLFILLVVIVIVGVVVPNDIRTGYLTYWYGRIIDTTSGDIGKAAAWYHRATDAMPGNATFARAYASSLNDMADGFPEDSENKTDYYLKALEFAKGWIEANEGSPEVWQLLVEQARAEWGLGRKNSAKVAIDEAVELMPTDYIALVYQGIIWRDMQPDNRNMVAKSIPIFEQAIQVRRESRTSWAHYELAVAYNMLKDEARALNELEQALAQWPPRELRFKIERLKHHIQSSGRSTR